MLRIATVALTEYAVRWIVGDFQFKLLCLLVGVCSYEVVQYSHYGIPSGYDRFIHRQLVKVYVGVMLVFAYPFARLDFHLKRPGGK